jgi:hypothetical protein
LNKPDCLSTLLPRIPSIKPLARSFQGMFT